MKLDKRTIAEGGLELLAAGGLKNLTTRRLADHFGIKSASLYHHFRSKQQLLDHVADAMIHPALQPAATGEPWHEWIVSVAAALRRCILAYPDGGLLYAGASPPVEIQDERVDFLYKPLLDAGLSRDVTRDTVLAVIRFTIGWVVDEQVAVSRGAGRPGEMSGHGFEFGVRALVQGVLSGCRSPAYQPPHPAHQQRIEARASAAPHRYQAPRS